MTPRSLVPRVIGRARREIADFSLIGMGLIRFHASRLSARRQCTVNLGGVGEVTVRPHESDLATIRQIFHDEEYRLPVVEVEAALRAAYEKILSSSKTPVVADAGANIGAATLWLRRQYPNAHVVAIEPDGGAFELLKRNVAGDPRVTAMEAAIGSAPGYVNTFTAGDSWATQTERADAGIPITTMQEAFEKVPNGKPFIAKIDIEGFEGDLFERNLSWLDEVQAVFIEPHDWRFPGKHTSRSFQRAMGEREFDLFVVGENLLYVRL